MKVWAVVAALSFALVLPVAAPAALAAPVDANSPLAVKREFLSAFREQVQENPAAAPQLLRAFWKDSPNQKVNFLLTTSIEASQILWRLDRAGRCGVGLVGADDWAFSQRADSLFGRRSAGRNPTQIRPFGRSGATAGTDLAARAVAQSRSGDDANSVRVGRGLARAKAARPGHRTARRGAKNYATAGQLDELLSSDD